MAPVSAGGAGGDWGARRPSRDSDLLWQLSAMSTLMARITFLGSPSWPKSLTTTWRCNLQHQHRLRGNGALRYSKSRRTEPER